MLTSDSAIELFTAKTRKVAQERQLSPSQLAQIQYGHFMILTSNMKNTSFKNAIIFFTANQTATQLPGLETLMSNTNSPDLILWFEPV